MIPLQRQKLRLEGEITALEADTGGLTTRRITLEGQLREIEASVEAKERDALGLDSRVQFLQEQISPLEADIVERTNQLGDLKRREAEYEGKIATVASEHAQAITEAELEIGSLLEKQRELEVAQANMLRQYDQMSEDIATRTKVADEREVVLKRREMKVAQDERMVARNAGLINL